MMKEQNYDIQMFSKEKEFEKSLEKTERDYNAIEINVDKLEKCLPEPENKDKVTDRDMAK